MSEIKVKIGTDANGKSKLMATMENISLKLLKELVDFEQFEDQFSETPKEFNNMVDFIRYIVEHGDEIIENINNRIADYGITVDINADDFVNIDMSNSGHFNMYISMDADFIVDEMKEDKETLRQIEELAQKRIDWYRKGN